MIDELQVFNYDSRQVRTVIQDGEPWFVAKDVCDILEIKDVSMATQSLDDDEKDTSKIGTPGGMQTMTTISEPGLYALVLKSRKPEAKQFSHWVRHEVLPSIRKTGSYSIRYTSPALPPGAVDGAKTIFETAGLKDNQLSLALDRIYRRHIGYSALEAGKVELIAPTAHQVLTPTNIGKHFGLKAHRVNKILAEAGFQRKIENGWEALPQGEPYAVMVDVGKWHGDGTPIRQLKWDSSILGAFEDLLSKGK